MRTQQDQKLANRGSLTARGTLLTHLPDPLGVAVHGGCRGGEKKPSGGGWLRPIIERCERGKGPRRGPPATDMLLATRAPRILFRSKFRTAADAVNAAV